MKQKLIIGAIAISALIAVITLAFYAGKRIADREAREHELRVQLQGLKDENQALRNQRVEIKQDTTGKLEATRSNRAQIESNEARIQDAEANVGIHIRPSEPSVVQGSSPDAPSFVLQQSELPLLTNYITSFKLNAIELDGCKKELGVCDKQVANLNAQTANVGEQLKIEKKKSGLWGKVKWAAIGIGIGAAAGYVAHR